MKITEGKKIFPLCQN